jgi:hypothetical protein
MGSILHKAVQGCGLQLINPAMNFFRTAHFELSLS